MSEKEIKTICLSLSRTSAQTTVPERLSVAGSRCEEGSPVRLERRSLDAGTNGLVEVKKKQKRTGTTSKEAKLADVDQPFHHHCRSLPVTHSEQDENELLHVCWVELL